MQFLVLIAAAASLAAASGSAGSLRDRRALRARDGAKRGAAADAVEVAARGSAMKTEKVCGMDVQIFDDGDFLAGELSQENLMNQRLGGGGFGSVHKVAMKKEAFPKTEEVSKMETVVALKIPKLESKTDKDGKALTDGTRAGQRKTTEVESAVGQLVCRHGDPACPTGSPFVSFIGKFLAATTISNCRKEVGGCPLYELALGKSLGALLETKTKEAEIAWNAFLEAHSTINNDATEKLRNLDAVLVMARQLASAVVRLQELGITHHDIKPDNIMLAGAAGIKLIDFGLACVGDGVVTKACPSLLCNRKRISGPYGTYGYISPNKVSKKEALLPLCGEKDTCTATDLRSVDLFSVGVTLAQLLTGAELEDMFPDKTACYTDKDDTALYKYSMPLFSRYISLERYEPIKPTDFLALSASRARLFTFLAKVTVNRDSRLHRKREKIAPCVLCGNAPMSYFLSRDAMSTAADLKIPRCYKTSSGDDSKNFPNDPNKDLFRLTVLPSASVNLAKSPGPWAPGSPDQHLLPVPDSLALRALLDLLRKLLAMWPKQGFDDDDAKLAVAAIDEVRSLLRVDSAAAAACDSIAALALKQIGQRDSVGTALSKAGRRPSAADVDAAQKKCYDNAARITQNANAQSADAKQSAKQRANSATSRRASSAPLQVPVPQTFEILPFAIPSGGVWVAHRFTLECDVINGATGQGVWVTWRKGSKVKGMGYIEEIFDRPPIQALTYTCSKRYLRSVKATSCKALKLLDATPRGALKPTNGFLKIFSKNGASSSLIDAVKNMAAVCLSANGDEALRQFKMDLVGVHEDRKVMGKAKGRRNTV
jgi:serine/threonine protein kinase